MRYADRSSDMHEIESLIYRLFAEKQFAVALLALVMVAQLATAQFLLLRMSAAATDAAPAPDAARRIDVVCGADGMVSLDGLAVSIADLSQREVVVHVPAEVATCIEQLATAPGVGSMVVGVPAGPPP